MVKSSPKLEENVWYKLEVEQLLQNNQVIFFLKWISFEPFFLVLFGSEIFWKRNISRIAKSSKTLHKCEGVCQQIFSSQCCHQKPSLQLMYQMSLSLLIAKKYFHIWSFLFSIWLTLESYAAETMNKNSQNWNDLEWASQRSLDLTSWDYLNLNLFDLDLRILFRWKW